MKVPALAVALLLGWATPASSHENHTEAPGTEDAHLGGGGPIAVSEVARRNLGLQIEEVELRSLETTLGVIGEITPEPERSGTVSSRIEGRVTAVFAKEGESVRRGQTLVEIESLQIGDPPPRARYASPIDGTVTDRHVVAGDQVEPNRHLFEITDLRELLAVGRVFEGQIGRVKVGQTVRVRVPSYPGETFDGVVERLGGQLDRATRSLAVYVSVRNPDERLKPNMRATLSLVTGGADLALTVPRSAVLGEGGALFAFVQRDDSPDLFDRRAVVTGISDDRYVEIIDGLLPGERVVTEGNYSLQYLAPVPEPMAEAPGEVSETAHSHAAGSSIRWWLGAAALAAAILGALAFLRARRPKEAH